jgi:hypothetical protein
MSGSALLILLLDGRSSIYINDHENVARHQLLEYGDVIHLRADNQARQ